MFGGICTLYSHPDSKIDDPWYHQIKQKNFKNYYSVVDRNILKSSDNFKTIIFVYTFMNHETNVNFIFSCS